MKNVMATWKEFHNLFNPEVLILNDKLSNLHK